MNKYIIFLPLLLTGCFMYDNIKQGINCSFDDAACHEYESEENKMQQRLSDMDAQAEAMIEKRCTQIHKAKKGTMQYMHCQERIGAMYRIDREYDGIDEAFRELRNSFADQEMTCEDYGMKAGTKNFTDCVRELENKYIRLRAAKSESEAQRLNRRVNCTTQRIFGNLYTTCE